MKKPNTGIDSHSIPYKKILLVGGGTGGHVMPLVSLISYPENAEKSFIWVGGENSLEQQEATRNSIPFFAILTLKLATTHSPSIAKYPGSILLGILQARKIIQAEKPELVFSKGGPGSLAVGIAAWLSGVPLWIHESDTIPGNTNRILGRFAERIFLGFESAARYFDKKKCETIGQILHPVFSGIGKLEEQGIRWQTTKPHILVICGSQGSQIIFEEIVKNYAGNAEYEWIIALGKLNSNMRSDFEKIPDCQALEWISQSDIAHLIRDTDLAITRGSATTLAELTAIKGGISQKQEDQGRKIFSKEVSGSGNDGEINFSNDEIRSFSEIPVKLVIIPLPYAANNHQYYNALEYEKLGHTVLEQKSIDQLTKIIQENV